MRALPFFLQSPANGHSFRFKGGGGGGGVPAKPPAYNPPKAPTAWDTASPQLQTYLAEKGRTDYYDVWSSPTGGAGGRSFGRWLTDHMTENADESAWQDQALSDFAKTGTFKAPKPAAQPPADLPPELNLPPVSDAPLTPNLPPIVPPTGGGGTVKPPAGPPKADAPVVVTDPVTKVEETIAPPTPIKAPPPVTDRMSEIIMAGRDARKKAQSKKGYMSTLLAGETGGFTGNAKTLLGGGESMGGNNLLG
jgi:hypothetical protein